MILNQISGQIPFVDTKKTLNVTMKCKHEVPTSVLISDNVNSDLISTNIFIITCISHSETCFKC